MSQAQGLLKISRTLLKHELQELGQATGSIKIEAV